MALTGEHSIFMVLDHLFLNFRNAKKLSQSVILTDLANLNEPFFLFTFN